MKAAAVDRVAQFRRYMTIERNCLKARVISKPFGAAPNLIIGGSNRRWKRLSEVRETLSKKLVDRLRTGEWTATGILSPVSTTSERILILPHLWGVLEPDFEDSSAKSGNLLYLDVRVYQPTPRSAGVPDQGALAPAALANSAKAKNRKSPHESAEQSAARGNAYQAVHNMARRVFGKQSIVPEFDVMAKELAKPEYNLEFKKETIRQILNGSYRPAVNTGIGRFEMKPQKPKTGW